MDKKDLDPVELKKDLTQAEEHLVNHLTNPKQNGSFIQNLIPAIFAADINNKTKLARVFPEYVSIIIKYQNDWNYYKELEYRWNKKYPDNKVKL